MTRLRNGDTRRCPFGKGMPRCDLRPEDPCPICGMTGDNFELPDKCVEADQGPLHLEAADAIEALFAALESAQDFIASGEQRADRRGDMVQTIEAALRKVRP